MQRTRIGDPKPLTSTLTLRGRILFLSESADVMRRQLAGETVSRTEATPLRDDVSTDEITPVPILSHYDHRLGRYPYTGYRVEDQRPISPGSVLKGGFSDTAEKKRRVERALELVGLSAMARRS